MRTKILKLKKSAMYLHSSTPCTERHIPGLGIHKKGVSLNTFWEMGLLLFIYCCFFLIMVNFTKLSEVPPFFKTFVDSVKSHKTIINVLLEFRISVIRVCLRFVTCIIRSLREIKCESLFPSNSQSWYRLTPRPLTWVQI